MEDSAAEGILLMERAGSNISIDNETIVPLQDHSEEMDSEDDKCPDHMDIPYFVVPIETVLECSNPKETRIGELSEAICDGSLEKVKAILNELPSKTFEEFKVSANGQTYLMKALLNFNEKTKETVELLLTFAEDNGFLKVLINAEYENGDYKGQTALHIAIERRCKDIVKLLLNKGADVDAKACGDFFNPKMNMDGFYFGETPLALAACTNQLEIVQMLLEKGSDTGFQDSRGNTVLHALVEVADDSENYINSIKQIYEEILTKHEGENLEAVTNNKNLTPVHLAAQRGKRWILKYILERELKDKKTRNLSRKHTTWAYGPVSSSVYDLTGLDADQDISVLKLIVYNSEIPERHEMLALEPLNTVLCMKWEKFASKMFSISFLFYFTYNVILTLISYYRPNRDKFPVPLDLSRHSGRLHFSGQVFVFICAIYLMIKESIELILLRPSDLKIVLSDAWFHITFFLQAALIIVSSIMCWSSLKECVIVLVLGLSLGWINMLYYTRGFETLGIYSVMVQKVILNDVLKFLLVYALFLLGFGVALASLVNTCPDNNDCSPYSSYHTTVLELFKLTLGLGDLELQKHSLYPELFLALLVLYVLLTFVLLLNMLIALMGETVEELSKKSKNIWKLQRARTILDLERRLPPYFRKKFRIGQFYHFNDNHRWCIRINELNWTEFNTSVACTEEDPAKKEHNGSTRRMSPLLPEESS
ncbi:transient receptor potential cation channel subfamily V member 3-like isoform X2 [Latimeria chalumnae]|uniref:transient receptor potential cation channel subfamily V member 3-like isoform X2 n=1 Tax=Latimeria chalumnae TaxID=7897 RepID=UPI0003C1898E|nr:PREDICTED: transient receptor potential cation channel subfamily V member 3-like isoform X2 [Latimeria chalumnae]|eukprot:XP_006010861.1 PREDICTED: transient receptor potential cation channel subfamily V member 3-like isoform X2 [Latimeria chalumnae]